MILGIDWVDKLGTFVYSRCGVGLVDYFPVDAQNSPPLQVSQKPNNDPGKFSTADASETVDPSQCIPSEGNETGVPPGLPINAPETPYVIAIIIPESAAGPWFFDPSFWVVIVGHFTIPANAMGFLDTPGSWVKLSLRSLELNGLSPIAF